MNTKGLFILPVFITLLFTKAMAQQEPFIPSMIAPSPEAVSLGKYAELPVGKYTGSASITIPVYTIKTGGIQIPVSFSYQTGGIRVEEVSGWTGLGWTLNAGGVIAISTNGLSDFEDNTGYLKHSYDPGTFEALPEQDKKDRLVLINSKELDVDPDIYTYNINGQSGKFLIEKSTMKAVAIPMNDLAIAIPGAQSNKWEIKDANGNRYLFEDKETTYTQDGAGHGYTLNPSFYLTKIITATHEEVNFNYQGYTNNYYARTAGSKDYFDRTVVGGRTEPGCLKSYQESYSTVHVSGKRIESITWNGGKIKFKKSTQNREDLPGDHFLEYIEIYNSSEELLKKFKTSFDYFETDGSQNFTAFSTLMPGKRLRLTSIQEINPGGQSLPAYQFEYNSMLPYYFSRAQDLWGYYNGATGNTSLLQKLDDHLGDADRSANENAKAGTLSRITYPTGGHTQFNYECNDALIPLATYFEHTISPFSLINESGITTASIGPGQNFVNFTVDPQVTDHDVLKLFTYTITYPESINCPGTNKDCIGNLRIELESLDETFFASLENQLVFEDGVATGQIWLPAGKTYRFFRIGGDISGTLCEISGQKNPLTHSINGNAFVNVRVGGIRIASQVSTALAGAPPTTVKYFYHNNLSAPENEKLLQPSSGRLSSLPVFGYSSHSVGANYLCTKYTMMAGSMAPMAVNGGSATGYRYVQELRETGQEKIKTLTEFVSADLAPDFYSYSYPYLNGMSRDYLRGGMLNEKKFRFVNNNYELVSEEIITYNIDNLAVGTSITGCKSGCTEFTYNHMLGGPTCNNTLFKQYEIGSNWFYKTSSELKLYESPSRFVSTKENYTYNADNLQVSAIEKKDSRDNTILTSFKYPHDFPAVSPYSEMISRNMIAPVVETVVSNTTRSKEISKNKTSYAFWQGTDIIAISSVQKSFGGHNLEEELAINAYDNKGNMLEFLSKNGIRTSFVWGYNKTLPIAEVVNASHDLVFHTSFEDSEGNSADGDSKTGRKSKTNGYSKILADLPIGEYVYSYWQKDGNNWSLHSNTLSVASFPNNHVIAISGQVDDFRFHPAKAQMTTCTYDPLTGMTSKTDANNRASYYEYDSFGRLKYIRDKDKNIVRSFDYKYQEQQ